MKDTILATAALLLLAAAPAFSQEANSGAAAQAGANASVNGTSQSGAIALGGNNLSINNPADITTEVRNVPAVSAPGVVTAFNCAQAVSAGASIVGGGISFGGTYTDKNCERIAQAAALNTLAGADVALYHLASGSPEICASLRDTGRISPNSVCGDEPRNPLRPTQQPTASTKSPAPLKVAFTKCEVNSAGAILVGVKRGDNKDLAVTQCRARLGM